MTRYEERQRARERADEIWETARILNRRAGWAALGFMVKFIALIALLVLVIVYLAAHQ